MIIVIVLITIIGSFAIPKFTNMNYNANLTTLKSQLALIQSAISKQKNKNILLSNLPNISSLDDASTNVNNQELFKKVIDFSILSTSTISVPIPKKIIFPSFYRCLCLHQQLLLDFQVFQDF